MRHYDDDYEIDAIDRCSRALAKVDDKTKIRVIRFLLDKFNLIASAAEPAEKKDVVNNNNYYQQTNLVLVEPEKLDGISNPGQALTNGSTISIKDVLIKGLNKTEVELLLIICFYNSSFGNGTFTRQSILESYRENGIWTEIRVKNLTQNLKALIKRSFLSTITDEELSITPEGIEHAKNVLSGNSTTKKRKPRVKKAKGTKVSTADTGQFDSEDELNNDEES